MKKIIFLFLTIILLTGCGPKTQYKDETFTSKDKLSSNIKIKSSIVQDNLILFITNNNKETVDIKITIDYYDKSEKKIDTNEDIFSAIKAKKEIAIPFGIYKKYEYYKVSIETTKSEYTNYEDSLNISEAQDDKQRQMVFKVTNNGEKAIDYVDLTIIYFKNNNIIGIESDITGNLKPDDTATFKLAYPVTSNLDVLDFDNYKLYINEACTYNKEVLDEE